MNAPKPMPAAQKSLLVKALPSMPALYVSGPRAIAIKNATTFNGRTFAADTPLSMPELEPGADYGVFATLKVLEVIRLTAATVGFDCLGGFHFAPGGNAKARAGGDSEPAINPFSVWDINRRPTAPDPRGMFVIDVAGKLVWVDIYKLGKDHLKDGTSKFGVTIADGNDPPQNPAGGYFDKLDYATAVAVMKYHGKGLLSTDEFRVAALGVTELTVHRGDPNITKLDAPRTSQRGGMQMSGNTWDWGHDGDPDLPRASIFGGSWRSVDYAGSRFALVDNWPGDSYDNLGARGRCDHLQLD